MISWIKGVPETEMYHHVSPYHYSYRFYQIQSRIPDNIRLVNKKLDAKFKAS